jgi:hypothetical protein
MPTNPKLIEIKKEFEELVMEGILDRGFVVDSFTFSIPKEIENFFEAVANDVYIIHFALDTYLSKKEKAEFLVEVIKNRPIDKYSGIIDYLERIEKVRYKKFPKSVLHLALHFLVSQTSEPSKRIIRANRNLFTEYREDSLYISLYLDIKDFLFDFAYYGKVL